MAIPGTPSIQSGQVIIVDFGRSKMKFVVNSKEDIDNIYRDILGRVTSENPRRQIIDNGMDLSKGRDITAFEQFKFMAPIVKALYQCQDNGAFEENNKIANALMQATNETSRNFRRGDSEGLDSVSITYDQLEKTLNSRGLGRLLRY